MKIKLFISSSLGLAGLWLAAAYLHTVDVSSYSPAAPSQMVLETPEEAAIQLSDDSPPVALTQ